VPNNYIALYGDTSKHSVLHYGPIMRSADAILALCSVALVVISPKEKPLPISRNLPKGCGILEMPALRASCSFRLCSPRLTPRNRNVQLPDAHLSRSSCQDKADAAGRSENVMAGLANPYRNFYCRIASCRRRCQWRRRRAAISLRVISLVKAGFTGLRKKLIASA